MFKAKPVYVHHQFILLKEGAREGAGHCLMIYILNHVM